MGKMPNPWGRGPSGVVPGGSARDRAGFGRNPMDEQATIAAMPAMPSNDGNVAVMGQAGTGTETT